MTNDEIIRTLHEVMDKKLLDIGFYMKETMGFPLRMFCIRLNEMNMLGKLCFINGFAERYPKIICPIYYKKNV